MRISQDSIRSYNVFKLQLPPLTRYVLDLIVFEPEDREVTVNSMYKCCNGSIWKNHIYAVVRKMVSTGVLTKNKQALSLGPTLLDALK